MRPHMPRGLRSRDYSSSHAWCCRAVVMVTAPVSRQSLPVATFTPSCERTREEEKPAILTDDAASRRCHLHLGTRSRFSPGLSLQRSHKGDEVLLFLLGEVHR